MSIKDRMDDATLLAEIERLIETYRPYRFQPNSPGYTTHGALRTIAADIRGRNPDAIYETHKVLSEQITAIVANRSPTLGYRPGDLHKLAEAVIGRWSTIEQALSKFEESRQGD